MNNLAIHVAELVIKVASHALIIFELFPVSWHTNFHFVFVHIKKPSWDNIVSLSIPSNQDKKLET